MLLPGPDSRLPPAEKVRERERSCYYYRILSFFLFCSIISQSRSYRLVYLIAQVNKKKEKSLKSWLLVQAITDSDGKANGRRIEAIKFAPFSHSYFIIYFVGPDCHWNPLPLSPPCEFKVKIQLITRVGRGEEEEVEKKKKGKNKTS